MNQMDNVLGRLDAERDVRINVQNGMETIQSQINQLSAALMTNANMHAQTTATTSVYSASLPTRPPADQSIVLPPGIPVFPNQMPQFPMQHNNLLNQINLLNVHMQKLREDFQGSQENLNDLYNEVDQVKWELNNQKQYNQRNNLIAHKWEDVPIAPSKPTQEEDDKFTEYVVEKMNGLFPGIDLTARDIDDTHILRTRKSDPKSHKQLVIIRLCSRLMRNKIFSRKSELKKYGYSLTEHLTAFNLGLLKEAQKRVGFKSAWTHYGKVLILTNGSIKAVRGYKDLDKFT